MAGIVIVMSNINNSTADKVAAAIARSENSIASIAEGTFIARSTLQRKLAGKSQFTVDDLCAIAQVIGVPTRSLIPDEIMDESSQAA